MKRCSAARPRADAAGTTWPESRCSRCRNGRCSRHPRPRRRTIGRASKECPECGETSVRLGPFMGRVRELLPAAGVLYADETPARAAGKLHYVHVACTEFLTAMHTGNRTSEAIDAGGVLPGYAGTIVRDGY